MKEKLQRVQAVRRWLEKAERSFSSHQEVSGEWNLIMAQAEMQRLKETDRTSLRLRLWGSRALALAAAAVLVSGYALWDSRQQENSLQTAPVEAPVSLVQEDAQASQPVPAKAVVRSAPKTVAAPPAGKGSEENADQNVPVSAAPVLTEWEIQSVVGEAGRTLRGQS